MPALPHGLITTEKPSSRGQLISALQTRLREARYREEEQLDLARQSPNPPKRGPGESDDPPGEEVGIDLVHVMSRYRPLRMERLAARLDLEDECADKIQKRLRERTEDFRSMTFIHDLDTGRLLLRDGNQGEDEKEKSSFRELGGILDDLIVRYGIDWDDMYKLLAQLSGDVGDLEKYLRGEKVSLWTEFEDTVLRHPENASMYRQLERIKGREAMQKRRMHLEIP